MYEDGRTGRIDATVNIRSLEPEPRAELELQQAS